MSSPYIAHLLRVVTYRQVGEIIQPMKWRDAGCLTTGWPMSVVLVYLEERRCASNHPNISCAPGQVDDNTRTAVSHTLARDLSDLNHASTC